MNDEYADIKAQLATAIAERDEVRSKIDYNARIYEELTASLYDELAVERNKARRANEEAEYWRSKALSAVSNTQKTNGDELASEQSP